MTRRSILALCLLMSFFCATVDFCTADDDYTGQWWIDKRTESSKGYCLTLRYEHGSRFSGSYSNWENSFWLEASQLRGFREEVMSSSGTQATFDIVRDAGTFHATGWFASGKGSGHFQFESSRQFISELEKRGIGSPTPDQQMQLALNNMSLELVDLFKKSGYTFDITELVRAGNHGVSMEYVKGMNALGYKPDTLTQLVKMRDHGVDPDYVRELSSAGLKSLSAEEIVKMRDHGVDPQFIHGLAEHGIKGLSGQELARLRDHGVDPTFIAAFQKMDSTLGPNDFVRLRDHGVDARFAVEVRSAGYKDVTVSDLVRLRDHGVNADFIKEHGKDRTLQEIIRLHDRGGWND